MSQQALDLRKSVRAARRHKKVFSAIVTLGTLGGVGYALATPPQLTGTALVVLPAAQAAQSQQSTASSVPSSPSIATEVVIASSNSVLGMALPHVRPAMSLQTLKKTIQVTNPAGSIISVSATGQTAAQAEATANAVANSYIAYVSAQNSPVGQVSARLLEPATTVTGSGRLIQTLLYGFLGVLIGLIVGVIASLALDRSDRRLVERDAIANSIGVPVLAAVPAGHPSDAASWARLLDEYDPGVVHGWGLTRLLRQLGAGEAGNGRDSRPSSASLTVISLSSDPGALALGPQLAAFAAAQGIPTALVIGPQQDTNITATLRTACAASQPPGHRKPLQLIVADDGHLGQVRAALVVVIAVIDGHDPLIPSAIRTNATVLGVSAGGATAEQLARAATAVAADGREVAGILVANPDPSDPSTGRIPRLAPLTRRQLPTRVNDLPTGSRR